MPCFKQHSEQLSSGGNLGKKISTIVTALVEFQFTGCNFSHYVLHSNPADKNNCRAIATTNRQGPCQLESSVGDTPEHK